MNKTTCSIALAGLAGLASSALGGAAPRAGTQQKPIDPPGHEHHQHGPGEVVVHHEITTSSPEAQRLFDLGLTQAFGFNHEQAAASFRAALAADPGCAMCAWGIALVVGPNINFPMDRANHEPVLAALAAARAAAPRVSALEQAYIAALGERYAAEWPEDRAPLDQAYARAMRRVANAHSDDLDAAVLFAEALMDTTPWDYWLPDGSPKPVTEEFLGVLESAVKRDPNHPGAAHYLIHTVEKARPELGVPAADRLATAPQVTGHLRHMASHIYLRVGRYHDASRVNQEAIAADEKLLSGEYEPGNYSMILAPHNVHMLWAAATFEGRSQLALEAAHKVRGFAPPEVMRTPGFEAVQHFWATPLFAQVRFGRWPEILAAPEPDADLLYARGVWHYARGMAQVRAGDFAAATAELSRLRAVASDPGMEKILISGLNPGRAVLDIAAGVLGGELAAARGDTDRGLALLERAVAAEEALTYDEPPPWHFPVRQSLGAVLLAAGRHAAAEQVYRADLLVWPHNGWSLTGLRAVLAAQNETAAAAEVGKQLEQAFMHADLPVAASRF